MGSIVEAAIYEYIGKFFLIFVVVPVGIMVLGYIICIIVEVINEIRMEMSRNVQSGNTQNLKSTVIQRSFPKWSVAERRKTAAASDQAAVCACAHSRYFAGGSPSGLRV